MMSEQTALTTVPTAALMPAMDIGQAVARYQAMGEFVRRILREGVDFGKIPGTGDKPTLLKAGAEKLTSFFGLRPTFEIVEKTEDWTGQEHGREPFFYYHYRCRLWRAGEIVAEGDGSCNSWESKYRYRKAERVCPACGQAAIIKGKAEYGGGWLCFGKKGGCGAKFADNDAAIVGQEVGRVLNPDVADQVNTIQKMAQKRALVAATLIGANASDYFTQDIEDLGEFVNGEYTILEDKKPKQGKKPGNGSEEAKAAFFARVLREIPYYEHINHVSNALKQAGFTAYAHSKEAEMLAALEKHAGEAANKEAA